MRFLSIDQWHARSRVSNSPWCLLRTALALGPHSRFGFWARQDRARGGRCHRGGSCPHRGRKIAWLVGELWTFRSRIHRQGRCCWHEIILKDCWEWFFFCLWGTRMSHVKTWYARLSSQVWGHWPDWLFWARDLKLRKCVLPITVLLLFFWALGKVGSNWSTPPRLQRKQWWHRRPSIISRWRWWGSSSCWGPRS